MPSLLSQFLPSVSSSAKTDFIRFPAAGFTAGARSEANCGGATTRTAGGACWVEGVCGTTGFEDGKTTGAGVSTGLAGATGCTAAGWDSRATGACSCLAGSLTSLATGCLEGGPSAGRTTGALVGQFSTPPACTVPHQAQNLGGCCLAGNSGLDSTAGKVLGGTAIGGLGTGAAGGL